LIEKEFYLKELERKLQQTGGRLPPSLALPPEVERGLSPRQQEILQLLTSGLTNEEIAKECFISVDTVKTHCRSIYRRIGVKNPREFRRKIRSRHLKPEISV